MTNTQILLILFVVLVVAAAFLFLWRRTGDRPATPITGEGHGAVDGAAAAFEDVADQFLGTDSHPALPPAGGPADPLTTLKGLGPKAAAQLNALGISRFDQLAKLDDAQVMAVDAAMGPFRGRMVKDQWVEQARHLAAGDRAGFEAKFGKLGG